MKQFILSILILNISIYSYCQDSKFTNVDTNYIKPSWLKNNLDLLEFRNGESLTVCEDTNTWKFLNSKSNPSMVFVNKNEFYYNYNSIIDERKLCPNGYKIPEYKDFLSTKLTFQQSGMLDNSDGALVVLEKSNNSSFFATKTQSTIDSIYYYSSAHLYKDDSWHLEEWPVPKNSGLSVKCITDMDEIINDSIFNYKKLLPDVYEKLLFDLSKTARNGFTEDDFVYQVKGSIDCNKTGDIKSSIISDDVIFGELKKPELLADINSIMKDFDEVPYYKGIIVMAHSDLSLTFKIETHDLPRLSFESSTLKNKNTNAIFYANENKFKIRRYKETLKIEDNENIFTSETIYVKSFKGRGPLYSIASVLPGLGLYSVTRKGYKNAPKKALLISSISLGAISIGSKIVSNIYYNRYKNDLFGTTTTENYKTANTFQKVFLTTGVGYCFLGAIDFTWTFSIGCKNKATQLRLNNQIKANPSNFILK